MNTFDVYYVLLCILYWVMRFAIDSILFLLTFYIMFQPLLELGLHTFPFLNYVRVVYIISVIKTQTSVFWWASVEKTPDILLIMWNAPCSAYQSIFCPSEARTFCYQQLRTPVQLFFWINLIFAAEWGISYTKLTQRPCKSDGNASMLTEVEEHRCSNICLGPVVSKTFMVIRHEYLNSYTHCCTFTIHIRKIKSPILDKVKIL